MNTIREIQKINDAELEAGISGTPASWHQKYAKSAWVFIGNLSHDLTEGDVICVMSQYGEIEDLHLVREEDTGKSKGFAFCKYEDARSCVLAVDNFQGIELCGRSLRVDHVENYRLPKEVAEKDEKADQATRLDAGHAYQNKELENEYDIRRGHDLFAAPLTDAEKKCLREHDAKRKKNEEKNERKEAKRQRKEERAKIRARREERRRCKQGSSRQSGSRSGSVDASFSDEEASRRRRYDND